MLAGFLRYSFYFSYVATSIVIYVSYVYLSICICDAVILNSIVNPVMYA